MASHLAMFVLCWIVFAPARKPYPGFANFIDEWSQCDFCFTNFGVILEYLESSITTKKAKHYREGYTFHRNLPSSCFLVVQYNSLISMI